MSDKKVEIYKLEYEKAADRYQEIYRSMWTIFSYLTAISAALLAFGADKVDKAALFALSVAPLEFWFWTTYLPLDRYGNNVVIRLEEIEQEIGAIGDRSAMKHFTNLAQGRKRDDAGVTIKWAVALGKFLRGPSRRKWSDVWAQMHRARFAIVVVFLALHVVFFSQAWAYYRSGRPFLTVSSQPVQSGGTTIK